jgi:hypothetical protein
VSGPGQAAGGQAGAWVVEHGLRLSKIRHLTDVFVCNLQKYLR